MISSLQWAVQLVIKTKIDIDEGWQNTVCHACMRGVASSSTHCGRKHSRQVPSEKTMSIVLYVVLQLPLLLLANFNSSWVITH